jgi:hypothetical protein
MRKASVIIALFIWLLALMAYEFSLNRQEYQLLGQWIKSTVAEPAVDSSITLQRAGSAGEFLIRYNRLKMRSITVGMFFFPIGLAFGATIASLGSKAFRSKTEPAA